MAGRPAGVCAPLRHPGPPSSVIPNGRLVPPVPSVTPATASDFRGRLLARSHMITKENRAHRKFFFRDHEITPLGVAPMRLITARSGLGRRRLYGAMRASVRG